MANEWWTQTGWKPVVPSIRTGWKPVVPAQVENLCHCIDDWTGWKPVLLFYGSTIPSRIAYRVSSTRSSMVSLRMRLVR